jgi:hypothetical protein
MREVNENQDILDSRDIQERIDELELYISDDVFDEMEKDELESLQTFKDEVDSTEWDSGITFIRDSYFVEFAQQEAEDLGLVQDNISWPYTCINWDDAADELRNDYSSIDFNGVGYWYRSY